MEVLRFFRVVVFVVFAIFVASVALVVFVVFVISLQVILLAAVLKGLVL
jgi:hypothetical protein